MEMRSERGQHVWSRLPGRLRRGILVAIVTLLVGWSAAWSQTPPPTRMPVSPDGLLPANNAARQPGKGRLREGTELQEARGYFRFVDDRVVFFRSNGVARYIGLENLNLERIVSEITNNPTQLEWTVVGTITEYRGANYLVVRRAVLSRATPEFTSTTTSPPSE